VETDTRAPFTMYTTPWCGDCIRLKRELGRAGVAYREIDISEDTSAVDLVVRLNDGNQTVPTLVFADGTVLAEPSAREVLEVLDRLTTAGRSEAS
jgi:mycoredoxin